MQHDPDYGNFEDRIRALERAFDTRVTALENALDALIKIVEHQEKQQALLLKLIEERT